VFSGQAELSPRFEQHHEMPIRAVMPVIVNPMIDPGYADVSVSSIGIEVASDGRVVEDVVDSSTCAALGGLRDYCDMCCSKHLPLPVLEVPGFQCGCGQSQEPVSAGNPKAGDATVALVHMHKDMETGIGEPSVGGRDVVRTVVVPRATIVPLVGHTCVSPPVEMMDAGPLGPPRLYAFSGCFTTVVFPRGSVFHARGITVAFHEKPGNFGFTGGGRFWARMPSADYVLAARGHTYVSRKRWLHLVAGLDPSDTFSRFCSVVDARFVACSVEVPGIDKLLYAVPVGGSLDVEALREQAEVELVPPGGGVTLVGYRRRLEQRAWLRRSLETAVKARGLYGFTDDTDVSGLELQYLERACSELVTTPVLGTAVVSDRPWTMANVWISSGVVVALRGRGEFPVTVSRAHLLNGTDAYSLDAGGLSDDEEGFQQEY